MSSSFSQRAVGYAWLAGWRLARALPERTATRVFERLGDRSYKRNPTRRAKVEQALEPVVGKAALDDTVREAFRSYARYWAETFRMQDIPEGEFQDRHRGDGLENIQAALAAGKGGIFALPHLGNWDAAGRWATGHCSLTVVVEVLRPREVFERFVAHRRGLGMGIIPLERGTDALGQCADVLAKGEFIALVTDRDLSGTGVEVTMFGRRTKLPAGPAVLTLRTGAPLLPVGPYQEPGGRWCTYIGAPLPVPDRDDPDAVRELTQRLASAFEEIIKRAPAQWHMFNRFWVDA